MLWNDPLDEGIAPPSFDETDLGPHVHLQPMKVVYLQRRYYVPVWPDWTIYWTLGNFLKPLVTINLPKISHILGQFL